MRTVFLISALVSLLLIAGCSGNTSRYRIGVSQCSIDEWRTKMNKEMEREALFYDGVQLDIRSSRDDNQKQIADIESMLSQGVDLMVISPNEAEALAPTIQKVYDKGIPVIIVDRKIPSDHYTAYVGADNYEIGKSAGEYAVSKLGGKGTIVEIEGLIGSTPAMERHKGFLDAISKSPGLRVISIKDGKWLEDVAKGKMDSVLRVENGIDMVFAHNDRMAHGAYLAAKQFGLNKGISFVGVDALPGDSLGLQQIIDGELDASFIYQSGGDKVVQTAMDILQKRKYDKDNILYTALIDKSNARLMQLQADEIQSQDERLEKLNGQIDEFWSKYSVQRYFLYAMIVCILLFAGLLTMILRAYWMKNRLNMRLSRQRELFREQRDKLISLSEQLREATNAKLVFFTNISHDLRTPLTLIADPIEQLMQDPDLTARQNQLLGVAHKNVIVLLGLINQILDFRKYENGKLELRPSPLNLSHLLNEWSDAFHTLATKKHISFTIGIDDADYRLMLDKDKIERIYFNLMSNAFKYTPVNGQINVRLSKIDLSGEPFVRMQITNSGKGISAEHIRNIFDRFYQIEINSSGSGIGLALVKAFVDLQKGAISVTSDDLKGTCFTVDLPAIPVPANTEIQEPSPESVASVRASIIEELSDAICGDVVVDDNKDTVLIIEDNADIRSYIHSLLRDKYSVIEAGDGRKGVMMAMKYVPDIIVSDVMMPVMDGLETCKLIKSEVQTSHIPVVMLTACSLDEQMVEGLECGADAYIAKPFNSKVLMATISNLIHNRRKLKDFFGNDDASGAGHVSDIDMSFAGRFRKLIEDNMSDPDISVEKLGAQMGMSRVQLYRKIKSLTNYSPVELLRIARLKKSHSLLSSTERSVAEIAYEVGFTSPSYFTKCYKEYFGENPTDMQGRKK